MRAPLWKYVAIGGACLAIGAAGTAGAGSLITGKSIKDGSIGTKDLSKKARKTLRGKAGPRGATGARGPAGTNGAAGSAAPSIVLGSLGVSSTSLFTSLVGVSGSTGEASAQAPIPPGASVTAQAFVVRLNQAPTSSQFVTVTLRSDGADTPLTCTIADSAQTCAATGATAALAAGALIDMHIAASGSLPAGTNAKWSFRLTP